MISDQSLIAPAVIVPLKFQILCSSGYRSRQTESYLNNFGSTVSEAHQVGTGDRAIQQFGYFKFQVVLRSKGERAAGLPLYRFDDLRVRMADNQRAPRQPVIQIAVSIDVENCEIRRRIQRTADTASQSGACRSKRRPPRSGRHAGAGAGSRASFSEYSSSCSFRLERVFVGGASFRLDKLNTSDPRLISMEESRIIYWYNASLILL